MFERFTDRARSVLVLAQEEARLLDHNFIGTEHILLGLIREGEGVAATALESLGVSLEAVREKVEETIGPAAGSPSGGSPPFTPRAKKVLELSLREALHLGHNYIGTEHMLLGLVREGEGVAAQALVDLGADLSRVRQEVIRVLSGGRLQHERAGVEPEAVTPSAIPAEPSALVTWEDVEKVLRDAAILESTSTHEDTTTPVIYRTCAYRPRPTPWIEVSVAGAQVTREAFDSFGEGRGWADVEDVGDAATFDLARGVLRVLRGTTLFIVSVKHHDEPLALASALARRAVQRLDAGPPPEPVG